MLTHLRTGRTGSTGRSTSTNAFTVNPDADALPPAELGLPASFTAWRTNQYEAVERILASTKRFVTICAPVGFGKSIVVAATAAMSGQRTAVLTMTRGLQDQYNAQLGEIFADVRGLANYLCPIASELGVAPTTTVADAPCQCGYACQLRRNGCGYYESYRGAQRADAFCTNYQCWLHDSRKDPEQMGNLQFGMNIDGIAGASGDRPVGILFCDEAHDVSDALSMFIGEDISRRECLQLHLPWPDAGGTVDDWCLWAIEQSEGVADRLKDIEGQLRGNRSNRSGSGWSRELKHLRDMKRKLDRLSAMRAEDEWILTETDVNADAGTMSAVRFDPLSPAGYAESALFRGIEKIVLVSATVRPKTAAMLGIAPADMEFVEYPSTFPVERRPIIHVPSVRVNFRTEQNDDLMAEWLKVIDDWIGPRLEMGRSGLIHAVSYRRAKFLLDNSRYSHYMMTHSAWDRARVVEEFRRSEPPCCLVSPSIDTGYDFNGEQARWQVICKIPFASVTDPVVKARNKKDRDYDLYQVAQTLVQASGRIVRAESDWGETLIADQNLEWCLPKMKAKGFLPKWWIAGFKSYDEAPAPIGF